MHLNGVPVQINLFFQQALCSGYKNKKATSVRLIMYFSHEVAESGQKIKKNKKQAFALWLSKARTCARE
jgi:hypothetical protein